MKFSVEQHATMRITLHLEKKLRSDVLHSFHLISSILKSQAKMFLQPTLLRFKFDNLVDSSAWSKVWSDYWTDQNGYNRHLQLKPKHTTDQETNPDPWVSLYLHLIFPTEKLQDNVEWKFTMIVQDAFGRNIFRIITALIHGYRVWLPKIHQMINYSQWLWVYTTNGALCVDTLLQAKKLASKFTSLQIQLSAIWSLSWKMVKPPILSSG